MADVYRGVLHPVHTYVPLALWSSQPPFATVTFRGSVALRRRTLKAVGLRICFHSSSVFTLVKAGFAAKFVAGSCACVANMRLKSMEGTVVERDRAPTAEKLAERVQNSFLGAPDETNPLAPRMEQEAS